MSSRSHSKNDSPNNRIFVSSPLIPTDLESSILSHEGSNSSRKSASYHSKVRSYVENKYNSDVNELNMWSKIGRMRNNSQCSVDDHKANDKKGDNDSDQIQFDMDCNQIINKDAWLYVDESGITQGPFNTSKMSLWYNKQLLSPQLKVKRTDMSGFIILDDLYKLFGRNPFDGSSKKHY